MCPDSFDGGFRLKALLLLHATCQKIVKAVGVGVSGGDAGDKRRWQ